MLEEDARHSHAMERKELSFAKYGIAFQALASGVWMAQKAIYVLVGVALLRP